MEPGCKCPGWPFTFASSEAIHALGEKEEPLIAVPETPETPGELAPVDEELLELEALPVFFPLPLSAAMPITSRNSTRIARALKPFPMPRLFRCAPCLGEWAQEELSGRFEGIKLGNITKNRRYYMS